METQNPSNKVPMPEVEVYMDTRPMLEIKTHANQMAMLEMEVHEDHMLVVESSRVRAAAPPPPTLLEKDFVANQSAQPEADELMVDMLAGQS